MKKMINTKTGLKLNVREHIILKNFWEYYVLENDTEEGWTSENSENEKQDDDIIFCYVMGFESELGYVSREEIRPYILSQTTILNDVMPAPNFVWKGQENE